LHFLKSRLDQNSLLICKSWTNGCEKKQCSYGDDEGCFGDGRSK
jgi:hypothetical protein